jgi:hypothetical protein
MDYIRVIRILARLLFLVKNSVAGTACVTREYFYCIVYVRGNTACGICITFLKQKMVETDIKHVKNTHADRYTGQRQYLHNILFENKVYTSNII